MPNKDVSLTYLMFSMAGVLQLVLNFCKDMEECGKNKKNLAEYCASVKPFRQLCYERKEALQSFFICSAQGQIHILLTD